MILLTLAVQSIILVVITGINAFGGTFGIVGLPFPSLLGFTATSLTQYLFLLGGFAVIVFVACWAIARSRFGLVLRGIREDQLATQSLGKNVFLYKVTIFGITAALAGLAGALYAYYEGTASPGLYGIDVSIAIAAMVVIGGRGNLVGSLLGAIVVVGTEPFFQKVLTFNANKAALVRLMFYGVILIVVMRLRPQGLLPEGVSVVAPIKRALRRAPPPASEARLHGNSGTTGVRAQHQGVTTDGHRGDRFSAERGRGDAGSAATRAQRETTVAGDPARSASPAGERPPIVEAYGISKTFGGIRAVRDLNLTLEEGRVTGLIGPNGSGKTTIFNILTGAIPPDAGRVLLRGEDITGWSLNRVATHGMVRSFQDVRVYANLTPLQNVMMAVRGAKTGREKRASLVAHEHSESDRKPADIAIEYLDFVGMAAKARQITASLPFGEQKLVALARVLAAEPDVLLLDEPASGIDKQWIDRILELVAELRDRGLAICLVEHNLEVVGALTDHIYFLESGTVTAEGRMEELSKEKRLIEAYFGTTT